MEYTREQLTEKVIEVICQETGYPSSSIKGNQSLEDDLDIDSISTMTILVNVEETFDFKIPDEDWSSLTTVDKIVDYLIDNKKEN